MNNLDLSENTMEFKTLPTRPRSHRYILIYIFAMESVKICHFETFWVKIFAREPCCCLDVAIYMLKCLFCRDIVLENEFKRCVYLDTNNHSSRWSLSKFVVSKHLW